MDVMLCSATQWIALFTTCITISVCGFFYYNYSYWKKKGVPYEEPFLFFGNLGFLMRKSFWEFCYELRKKHPRDYVGIFLAWRPALMVQTPELARQILVKDNEYFQDRYLYSRESDPLGSLNLFTMKKPLWAQMRQEMSPMFTSARLKQYTVLMNLNATELVRKIQRDFVDDNKPVNLKELFSMYTSDTVAYTAFGIRTSVLNDEESPLWYITRHMVKWTFRRGFEIIMIFLVPAVAAMLRLCFFSASATEFVKKIFWNVVNERKKMEEGNADHKDLLNYLLKLKENFKLPAEAGSELADNLMLAQAAVFILGAIETSSTVISYTLHELAYNLEAQKKLYNEVKGAIETSGKDILDYDELMGLQYLNACIQDGSIMTRGGTTVSTRLDRFLTSSSTPTASVPVAKPSANGSKRPTIIIYPTVTPESIVVPIVSCIFGFPLLALTVICCLRRRAKLARERARRRNCELDRGELSVVRLSPARSRPRAVSLVRSPRAPPSLELDTVLEERSDPDQTTLSQVEITPDREVGAILFGAMGAVGAAAAYAQDS